MPKLRLLRKDHVLLLNSEVTKDYPWFYQLLIDNEQITEEFAKNLPQNQQLFFENILNHVIKQAVSEWVGDENRPCEDMGTDKKNWKQCSLCGQPNRWIFYIINQLNSIRINVGRECVKHFGINVGRGRMTLEQLIKNAKRVSRMAKLNEKYPQLSQIIEGWDQYLDKLPIILPAYLEEPYLKYGEEARQLYEDYLDERRDESVLEEFRIIINNVKPLVKKIDQYIEENANDQYIPTREIGRWLTNKGDKTTLKMLKEDGRIRWRTAHRIEEPTFMKSIVPKLNQLLSSLGLNVEGVDSLQGGYVIQINASPGIRFLCKHKPLILDYGGLLFGQEVDVPLTLNRLVEISRIYDERSLVLIINEISKQIKGTGIALKDYSYEFNEIIVVDSQGKYILANLRDLAEQFKGLAIGLNDKNAQDIALYINKIPGKRYSPSEMRNLEIPKWKYI